MYTVLRRSKQRMTKYGATLCSLSKYDSCKANLSTLARDLNKVTQYACMAHVPKLRKMNEVVYLLFLELRMKALNRLVFASKLSHDKPKLSIAYKVNTNLYIKSTVQCNSTVVIKVP